MEVGGPILLPVSYGAGKMSVFALSRKCISLLVSSVSVVYMRAMKLFIYTSSRCRKICFLTFGLGRLSQLMSSKVRLSGCGDMVFPLL